MKDEIKEILDRLDYNEWEVDLYKVPIQWIELYDIRDCITNLQKELKEYKMLFDAFSERPYAHRYLEEKKKELGNSKIIGLDSEMIYKDYYDLKEENKQTKLLKEKYQLEKEVYKLKNEKAIEYIKQNKHFEWHTIRNEKGKIDTAKIATDWVSGNKLLNILNGGDEE